MTNTNRSLIIHYFNQGYTPATTLAILADQGINLSLAYVEEVFYDMEDNHEYDYDYTRNDTGE